MRKRTAMPERVRLRYMARDYGWIFSRSLHSALVRKGYTPVDAERILTILGAEARTLLVSGKAVGLPACPVLYTRRASRRVFGTKECKNIARVFVYTPRRFREDADATVIDRGDVRAQYADERLKMIGRVSEKKPAGRAAYAKELDNNPEATSVF